MKEAQPLVFFFSQIVKGKQFLINVDVL